MDKSVDSLTMLIPNLIHLTILAHGIHRICECLRNEYSTVKNKFYQKPNIFNELNDQQLKANNYRGQQL